ncbi:MAG: hypothetical protein HOH18_08185 [Kordiimonadaceae bacterium]|jgi:hypothetical protein|nr:hypothetical protein [Kordiimonadaceae bacterium]MBT6036438.1 hypothetical protein [Kordiimonadaceae bacterium]MBT7582721.1 hypothetical protein [Kordiimonadaceae bacterium]
MNHIAKFYLALIVLLTSLSLTGCGTGEIVIKNGPAGPNTKDMLRPLPDGLIADETNVRHGTDDLKPVIN